MLGKVSSLIYAEVVLFIEARRVACVANDKRCTVKMHATFIAANKQMWTLTHRSCAMNDGRAKGGGAVAWARVDLQAIVGTSDAVERSKITWVWWIQVENLPNHSVLCLRYTQAKNIKNCRTVILREEMVVLRGSVGFKVVLRADATIANKNSPAVIAMDVFVDSIGCCASSSRIH